MRTRCYSLMLAAAMACTAGAARPAGAAPAKDTGPPAAVQPQTPETRPSSPEDEALKRLVGKRTTTKNIMLSSGPVARPHTVLGPVSVEAPAPKAEPDAKPGPNLYMNELLRTRAVEQYGDKNVDAIMSITYAPAAADKLKASGVAVHFVEEKEKKKPVTSDK